jgi:hypothetical protein
VKMRAGVCCMDEEGRASGKGLWGLGVPVNMFRVGVRVGV